MTLLSILGSAIAVVLAMSLFCVVSLTLVGCASVVVIGTRAD